MKNKMKITVVVAIILILTSVSVFSIVTDKLPQYRKIIITSTQRTTMGQTLHLEGYIEPNAKQEVQLGTNQKVTEVYVKEGQQVKAGDLLYRLDDTDNVYRLKSEQLSLKAAQNELNNLLKSESQDKKDLASAVTQAEIQYNNAVADYNDSKANYEQNQKLFNEGFLSKGELDNAQKTMDKLQGAMKISEIQLNKSKDNLSSFKEQRQQQIDKLKGNIELVKLSIESISSQDAISAKALIDGIVVRCKLLDGQYPTSDNAKLQIYDLSKYVINLYVKQNEAVQIAEGKKAAIVVKGLEQKTYAGTVVEVEDTAVLPENGSKTPMVKIKVAVDEPDQNIKIGFETEVSLDLNIRTDVVAVNFQGVVEDHNGNKFVYLFKDNKAQRKLIKTGIEDGFMIEVVEGLIPGDKYVLNPPERVQNEASFKLWSWGYELK